MKNNKSVPAGSKLNLLRQICSGRLIFSGDTRQHGRVEATDSLVGIQRDAGLTPAELGHIRRQDPILGKTRDGPALIADYRRAVEAAIQRME